MIKKLTLIFAAAAMFFAPSCNKADNALSSQDEMVTVSYTVSLDNIATKVESEPQDGTAEYGQGVAINKVRCMVFTVNNQVEIGTDHILETYELFTIEESDYVQGNPIQFQPKFFRNQEYKIAFVAYNTEAYDISDGADLTYSENHTTITDPEKYDLFTFSDYVNMNGSGVDVTLTRPFTLWQVYTTDQDVEASETLGAKITSASVTATVNTKYNVLSGSFGYPAMMTFSRKFPADNAQTFDNQKYTLISSQYIMPSGICDLTLSICAESREVSSLDIASVPTVANQRVNIYGCLATSIQTFTVSISPGDNPPTDMGI